MRVVHLRKEPFDVRIDRKTKWGNPFEIGKDGTRSEVIGKHRTWITEGEGRYLLKDLHELKGKTLACWCAPLACHGDVLMELANDDTL